MFTLFLTPQPKDYMSEDELRDFFKSLASLDEHSKIKRKKKNDACSDIVRYFQGKEVIR